MASVTSVAKVEIIKVSDVIFREDLYPRQETVPALVQEYAEHLEQLPPIELNQHNELIDGWHRWTAHKKRGEKTIKFFRTETKSDLEFMDLAAERNSAFGRQLSQDDKRAWVRKRYAITPERERDARMKKYWAQKLSVGERTVDRWLEDAERSAKAARDKRICAAWLACYTQDEIAEKENVAKSVVHDVCSDFATWQKTDKSVQSVADHAIDFTPQLYNVWTTSALTNGTKHFGNSEQRWVDNLLYHYTKPFDTVVDCFAGGGSTIDVCKKRLRRYWVSDRLPVVERQHEIRKHDMTDGLPTLRWQDVRLVFLDPPYWQQAKGKYSKDKEDLANMALDEFTETLTGIINSFAKKLSSGAVIALMIAPTHWRDGNGGIRIADHAVDMMRTVNLPIDMRISCPYSTQQCTAQDVEWAKANREFLLLTREIVIWKVVE
jgi:DNA modification methylase